MCFEPATSGSGTAATAAIVDGAGTTECAAAFAATGAAGGYAVATGAASSSPLSSPSTTPSTAARSSATSARAAVPSGWKRSALATISRKSATNSLGSAYRPRARLSSTKSKSTGCETTLK